MPMPTATSPHRRAFTVPHPGLRLLDDAVEAGSAAGDADTPAPAWLPIYRTDDAPPAPAGPRARAHAPEGRFRLVLHYQPQLDLASGLIRGTEALVRGVDADGQLICPDAFVTDLESTGLIVPIGARILRKAVRQQVAWNAAGFGGTHVAVNLSPRQLDDPLLVEKIERILDAAGLRGDGLLLELTEGAVMSDIDIAAVKLRRLRNLGVRIALDDFGTGFSSLSWLRRLPVDVIKIDRGFVRGLGRDQTARAIVAAIVHLARALRLDTVAEGVETAAQAETLRELGCDAIQGHHFSRALPATCLPGLFAAQVRRAARLRAVVA